MYTETDPKVMAVLDRALHSPSRSTRLRAVAMLARVACEQRARWLAEALSDGDAAVRETALVVEAWVADQAEAPWPQREDPAFDRLPGLAAFAVGACERSSESRWRWEYAVEVWREDGLLLGAFLATSVQEDDEHAKRVALGQAILSSATPHGDSFDPATAAAFIVGKRRVRAPSSVSEAPDGEEFADPFGV